MARMLKRHDNGQAFQPGGSGASVESFRKVAKGDEARHTAFENAVNHGMRGDIAVVWVDSGIAMQPGLTAKGYAYIQAGRGKDGHIHVTAFQRAPQKVMGITVNLPKREWAKVMTDQEFKTFAKSHDVDIRKA